MPDLVKGRWFALVDLALVIVCGVLTMFQPRLGPVLFVAALIPGGLRLAGGMSAFRRTPLDLFLAVFVLTAIVGYWAAYDRSAAWMKLWLILASLLLYRSIASQPRENLNFICWLLFVLSVGVSLYFFLTYDFVAAPRRLEFVNRVGRWLMEIRPVSGWIPIHPNYTAGLAAIASPFIVYPLLGRKGIRPGPGSWFLVAVGSSIILAALLMTTSRGVLMAALSGAGLWLVWRLAQAAGNRSRGFPVLVLVYLCAVVLFLYLGPAGRGSDLPEHYQFGDGSRAELQSRSLYLLQDYPVTGGGLGSFPGLYSRYILNIPYFNVPNSHNLFMDTGIEQGLLGGIAYLSIFAAAIWILSRSLGQLSGTGESLFGWLALFTLVAAFVHGMVDDYLYNGRGTFLSLLPAALAMLGVRPTGDYQPAALRFDHRLSGAALLVVALLFISFPKKILSIWYADVGAVGMARVELERFPNGGWPGPEITARMNGAEAALSASVQLDPSNRTANQRLGLISMLRRDFPSASVYLKAAYRRSPEHRGVVKSLGFCNIWTGDLPAAEALLDGIPETAEELDAYIFYWKDMGQADLSARAQSALPDFIDAVQP